jgi:uncharacterized protein YbjT (DUF2867 family)
MSTTPRRRLKPETRRNEIIEAAERLLRDRGPAVRVDDVVREAGAAKGTFYLYFPTWDDLLEVVRARVFEAFDAAHPAPGSSKVDADWKKDLEDYAEAFIDAAVAMGGIHDVIFHSGFAQRRPATGVVDTIGRLAAVLAAGRVAGAYAAVDTAPDRSDAVRGDPRNTRYGSGGRGPRTGTLGDALRAAPDIGAGATCRQRAEGQQMIRMQRVLVVGGTRGTGQLIAELLLRHGYAVRVLARDPAEAKTRLDPAIELVGGDITKAETLAPAVAGADHIVFTAGAPSGRYAPERLVRETDYRGVVNTIEVALHAGFPGRFLYLNSIGIDAPSLMGTLINLLKRNTFAWRRRAEAALRGSGIDYTIIRVGFLLDGPAGRRRVEVSQGTLPLKASTRIARADVAEAFAAALAHPNIARTTFEIVWSDAQTPTDWDACFSRLKPDRPQTPSTEA